MIHNTSRTVGAWVGKAACFSSAGAGLGALGEEPVAVETTAGGAQPGGECSPGSAGPGSPGWLRLVRVRDYYLRVES